MFSLSPERLWGVLDRPDYRRRDRGWKRCAVDVRHHEVGSKSASFEMRLLSLVNNGLGNTVCAIIYDIYVYIYDEIIREYTPILS